MRDIFDWIIQFSVLGPFGGYWLALVALFDHADATNDWGNWKLWITVPIWLVYTMLFMFYQIVFVPKVMNWVRTAETVEGKGDEVTADDAENALSSGLLDF